MALGHSWSTVPMCIFEALRPKKNRRCGSCVFHRSARSNPARTVRPAKASLMVRASQLSPFLYFLQMLRTAPFSPFAMPAHRKRLYGECYGKNKMPWHATSWLGNPEAADVETKLPGSDQSGQPRVCVCIIICFFRSCYGHSMLNAPTPHIYIYIYIYIYISLSLSLSLYIYIYPPPGLPRYGRLWFFLLVGAS